MALRAVRPEAVSMPDDGGTCAPARTWNPTGEEALLSSRLEAPYPMVVLGRREDGTDKEARLEKLGDVLECTGGGGRRAEPVPLPLLILPMLIFLNIVRSLPLSLSPVEDCRPWRELVGSSS